MFHILSPRLMPRHVSLFTLCFALCLLTVGCASHWPHTLQLGPDFAPGEGANAYAGGGDHRNSPYFRHFSFRHLKPREGRMLLHDFPVMQQTTEWSCGAAATLMVLRYLGAADTLTEMDVARLLHSQTDREALTACCQGHARTDRDSQGHARTEMPQPGSARRISDFGTRLADLHAFLAARPGVRIVRSAFRTDFTEADILRDPTEAAEVDLGNLRPTFSSPAEFGKWVVEMLKQGAPILTEWSDWNGHWSVIIGIDDMKTPDFTGDDVLLMADPYDTSDHCQDGFTAVPLERFFYMWHDRTYEPLPHRLQPFVCVTREGERR